VGQLQPAAIDRQALYAAKAGGGNRCVLAGASNLSLVA
jgi:hypothetical protein